MTFAIGQKVWFVQDFMEPSGEEWRHAYWRTCPVFIVNAPSPTRPEDLVAVCYEGGQVFFLYASNIFQEEQEAEREMKVRDAAKAPD